MTLDPGALARAAKPSAPASPAPAPSTSRSRTSPPTGERSTTSTSGGDIRCSTCGRWTSRSDKHVDGVAVWTDLCDEHAALEIRVTWALYFADDDPRRPELRFAPTHARLLGPRNIDAVSTAIASRTDLLTDPSPPTVPDHHDARRRWVSIQPKESHA